MNVKIVLAASLLLMATLSVAPHASAFCVDNKAIVGDGCTGGPGGGLPLPDPRSLHCWTQKEPGDDVPRPECEIGL